MSGRIIAFLAATLLSPTVTELIPATELPQSERGAFTAQGRFFVIYAVLQDGLTPRGAIAEVTRDDNGHYTRRDYLVGSLEGTVDGRVGSQTVGAPCAYGGLTKYGNKLYAGCYSLEDARVSLVEVDTETATVRAGYFTSCNIEPATEPCSNTIDLYPNGMSTDSAGRVYVSNMVVHLNELVGIPRDQLRGPGTILQISIDEQASDATHLAFQRRVWFGRNWVVDSPAPNGVQIEGDVLYYAAGPNINKVRILEDGSAGEFRVHYRGDVLTYTDDFSVRDGELVLGRTSPPSLLRLAPVPFEREAREATLLTVPDTQTPSSVTNVPAENPLFPAGSRIVTSYFGGGLYALTGL